MGTEKLKHGTADALLLVFIRSICNFPVSSQGDLGTI